MAFIVFEGLDASGKTTQIRKLSEYLRDHGIDVVVSREPGGTPLGEELRRLLLRVDGDEPVARCELLIYEAARAQHVEKVIKPALQAGRWVISDRFTASTVAFQSAGRKLDPQDIDWLNHYATDGVTPDLNIFIEISIDESERRKGQRSLALGQDQDRFEKEKRDFHELIRDSYQLQAWRRRDAWLCVNGERDEQQIFSEIISALKSRQWLES